MSMQKDQDPFVGKNKCIAPEDLSAALDGEQSLTEEQLLHLKHCPECRSLYESYKLLDDVLSHTLDIKCPESVSSRIRKQVAYKTGRAQKAQDDERKGFDFVVWAFRAAAMLALFGAASYLVVQDYSARKQAEAKIVSKTDAPLAAPAADNGSFMISSQNSRGEGNNNFPSGSVDIRNLSLTSGGSAHPFQFVDSALALQKKRTVQKVAHIAPEVQHVWLFEPSLKAPQTEKLFRKALRKADVPLKGIKFDLSPDGTLRADLELTRHQSVILVRALAAEKLMLVNSAQPQVEQRLFAGTGRELVRYKSLLIPKGK